jgi:hypothetical protein
MVRSGKDRSWQEVVDRALGAGRNAQIILAGLERLNLAESPPREPSADGDRGARSRGTAPASPAFDEFLARCKALIDQSSILGRLERELGESRALWDRALRDMMRSYPSGVPVVLAMAGERLSSSGPGDQVRAAGSANAEGRANEMEREELTRILGRLTGLLPRRAARARIPGWLLGRHPVVIGAAPAGEAGDRPERLVHELSVLGELESGRGGDSVGSGPSTVAELNLHALVREHPILLALIEERAGQEGAFIAPRTIGSRTIASALGLIGEATVSGWAPA